MFIAVSVNTGVVDPLFIVVSVATVVVDLIFFGAGFTYMYSHTQGWKVYRGIVDEPRWGEAILPFTRAGAALRRIDSDDARLAVMYARRAVICLAVAAVTAPIGVLGMFYLTERMHG